MGTRRQKARPDPGMNARPIKILHVAASTVGGVGVHILSLSKNLDRRRFEVAAAFGPGYPLDDEFRKEGIRTFFLSLSRGVRPVPALRGLMELRGILARERFDIVHTHTSMGGLVGRIAAKWSRVPVTVYAAHGYASHDHQFFLRKHFFLAIERALDRLTDHSIAISEFIRNQSIQKKITTAPKISVIHHGIVNDEPQQPSREEQRRILGLTAEVPVVGVLGRLEEQKGFEHFLKAAALVHKASPDCVFLIVGDGPLRGRLERLAAQLGIAGRTVFAGWREDVLETLRTMDVFCLPSLWEGFGLVLLEAMVVRRAIVANRIEAVPEVVRDGETGILVTPGDAREMADAVLRLLERPELAACMGEAGRRRVESAFDIRRMIRQYEQTYESLVASRATALPRDAGTLGASSEMLPTELRRQ